MSGDAPKGRSPGTLLLLFALPSYALLAVPWIVGRIETQSIGFVTSTSFVAGAVLVAAAAALFLAWRLAVVRAWKVMRAGVFALAILAALPLFFIPPLGSRDVYSYGYFGQLQRLAHRNPYTAGTDAADRMVAEDPLFRATLAPRPFATNYGPLWTLLERGIAAVSQGDLTATVAAFRLLGLIGFLGCIWLLSELLAPYPDGGLRLLLFAANPFLLFEAILNAHNDVWVALGILAAMAAWTRRRFAAAFFLLVVGGMVKFVPLVLIPTSIALLARSGGSRRGQIQTAAVGIGGGALATLPLLVHYWSGYATLQSFFAFNANFALPFFYPLAIAARAIRLFSVPVPMAENYAARLGLALFLLVFIALLLAIFRKQQRSPVVASLLVLAATILTLLHYFQPWYLLWVMPLVLLLRPPLWRRGIVACTLLGAALYLFY